MNDRTTPLARLTALTGRRFSPFSAMRALAPAGLPRIAAPALDVERIQPRLEQVVLGLGMINPVFSLPQMYNIFVLKHVAGLSVVTIAAALMMSLLWTAYGALGKQTAVWATNAVWIVFNGATLVGVAMFSR